MMGFRYQQSLERLKVPQLRQLASMSNAYRSKREKGGKIRRLRKDELIREIRRSLANTFRSRQDRANQFVESIIEEN